VRKIAALMLVLALCMMCVTGCEGGVGAILGGDSEARKSAVVSSDIQLPMEKIRTLNPIISKDEDTYFINKLIYDSLFELDEDLAAVPSLVEAWGYADDGMAVAFQLKNGLLWQDGTPFDGNDVAFSIQCYTTYLYDHVFTGNVQNISGATVDRNNPYIVTVNFKSADKTGTELFTFPILPEHLYKNAYELHSLVEEFIPIGTGAYAVTEFDMYSHITLGGNPYYYSAPPGNRLIFQIMPSREDSLNMLGVNAISYAVSRQGDRETIYRNADVKVKSFVSNEAVWIGFNFNSPVMKNKNARKAIAYAIDNKELLETCFFNSGVLCDTIYFPGFLGVGGQEDPYAVDAAEADTELAEAGFYDNDRDGYMDYFDAAYGDNGGWISARLKFLINGNDQSRVEAAKLIQTSLDRLGLVCELIFVEDDMFAAAVAEGNYDFYMGSASFNESYDLRFMLHSAYNNPISYSNNWLDILLDDFAASRTQEARKYTFTQIHTLLTEEIPYYCLFYKTYGAAAAPSMNGEANPSFNDFYRDCEGWRNVYTSEYAGGE
jgi:peptide/nickel transport system substrate-binding protein